MKTNRLMILKALAEKKTTLKAESRRNAKGIVQTKGRVWRKKKLLVGYQL